MKKQQGVTVIGFILLAILVSVMGVFAMRTVPVYLQYYQVVRAVDSLNDLPDSDFKADHQAVKMALIRRIMRQLYINEIRHVKTKNIKITYKKDAYVVNVAYEEQRPLVHNMRLLFDFNFSTRIKDRGR